MGKAKSKYFLTGLLIVMPVLVTVYLFVSLFSFFDNILGRYISQMTVAYFDLKIPGLGLLVFIFLIFFTGFFATNFIGRKLFIYFEKLWLKFPVVKKVYPAAKQVTHFLFSPKPQGTLHKVVLLHYPRSGIYSLGFVTNHCDDEIKLKTGKDLLNVLIPSVPNPWSGFVLFVPASEVTYIDMTVEEAIKIIVSGGVLNPKDPIDKYSSNFLGE
ncbi:MAG TPA: DUF502 domain-containing protein [Candidatus Omnitrophica bacterium]|nr:DUF502 domain-containing protein [Candidatus Omnitrophota bacterium]